MFKPNVTCQITRMNGQRSLYGQTLEGDTITTRCGVVRLDVAQQKTSVRADTSASRGQAREKVAIAVLLFSPDESLVQRDKVTVSGHELEIVSVFPRYNVQGDLDHYQVELAKWASG